ncbi:hypothetical protein C1645_826382 [Glomus cerebriforme]|uniref:Uncharacterized protein n=1 Tax=Glomus cerebriforme TaxID=658196 RepID=A0A397SU16_9GLOM|nr:hypothetical protein C1645_826382 [Glomus cerebriforme]
MARRVGQLKTNTVVQYDEHYDNVESLRYPALSKRPKKIKKKSKSVGFFNLGNLVGNVKLELPVDYEESRPKLEKNYSENLQFTTEAEAAAIYCMENSLKINELDTPGTNFMTADCGEDKQLGEITERAGDFCGKNKHYKQMQYMIQEFNRHAKLLFTGDKSGFTNYELDIEDVAPVVMGYVTKDVQRKMEEIDWMIERIIKMIQVQLDNTRETSEWNDGNPIERKDNNGRIDKFRSMARRGTVVQPNQEVTFDTDQDAIYFRALTFGRMEITATARNKLNGQYYRTILKLDILINSKQVAVIIGSWAHKRNQNNLTTSRIIFDSILSTYCFLLDP